MADDIVNRLREIGCPEGEIEPCGYCLSCSAANEIEWWRERCRNAEKCLDHIYGKKKWWSR